MIVRKLAVSSAIFLSLLACDPAKKKEASASGPASASPKDPTLGLSAEEKQAVLAKVGDRVITLGEYAASLSRLGEYERLRYQSKERQKELLDEMIEVELLAQEARRRGLDRDPELELQVDLALRDELRAELRRQLPPLESFSQREVEEYYQAHRENYREPERRRVQVMVLDKLDLAKKLAAEAARQEPGWFGQMAAKYSKLRKGLEPGNAVELASDLGFVSAPGEPRGENSEVPEPVREAIFRLHEVGDISPEVLTIGSEYYLVRYAGKSSARDRSLSDADRSIRVELARQLLEKREQELELSLRQKYPVQIDEAKLKDLVAQAKPK